MTEADSHLGVYEPPAGAFGEAGVPGVPARGPDGRQYVVSGRPVPAGTEKADREAARAASASRRSSLRADLRRLARRPPAQRRGPRGLRRGGALRGAARVRAPRLRRPGRAAASSARPALPAVRRTSSRSPTRWPPRTWPSRVPAARCSRWPRPACRRSWCPTRTPRPTTRPRTRATWSGRAPRSWFPTRELDGPRLAREVGALLGAPQRLAEMARAAPRGRGPDAAERIADELLALAGNDDAHEGRRGCEALGARVGHWMGHAMADRPARWLKVSRLCIQFYKYIYRPTLHLVGIGGAGMSGLALVAQTLGARVSGSVRAAPPTGSASARRGSSPRSATTPPTSRRGGRGGRLHGDPRRQPRTERRPRRGPARAPPWRPARRAHPPQAPRCGLRHSRQDHHHRRGRPRPVCGCGREPAYLVGGELRAARTNAAWGAGEWLWWRPTSPIARS